MKYCNVGRSILYYLGYKSKKIELATYLVVTDISVT